MSAPRYPIRTLADMSRIPAKAKARFLAELPAILDTISEMRAATPTLAAAMRAKAPWPARLLPLSFWRRMLEHNLETGLGAVWVDDDKGTATLRARMTTEEPAFYSRTEPMKGTPRA